MTEVGPVVDAQAPSRCYPINMLKRIISEFYKRLPVVRELHQIGSSIWQTQQKLNDLQAEIRAIEGNHVFDFEFDRHPRYQDPKRLPRYQARVNSQNGEDGILHEIFRRVGTTNRVFAEAGVGNGCQNNTAFLLSLGWCGYWVDGSDGFLAAIEKRKDIEPGCVKWLVSIVTQENIDDCFKKLGVPPEFDLLSLDIDQNTYYAWAGLCAFRPRVVVIEYNGSVPADIDWKVAYDPDRRWDGKQNFGASLKALEILGQRLGYCLVGCEFSGVNAFFVRDDLVQDNFAAPFTSENHYEPKRHWISDRQGYSATILARTTPS
jgi:hypothetical protein